VSVVAPSPAVHSGRITTEPSTAPLKVSTSLAPIRASPKTKDVTDKNTEIRASPKKAKKPANAASKVQKLEVRESRRNGQESWTIKAGGKLSFRVRLADSGFRVNLRFHDKEGKEREPYCCYLSASEWRAAKRQTLANFAALIVGKVELRKATEGNDTVKLDALITGIQSLT